MPPVAEVAGGAALPHPKPRRLLLSLSPSLSLSPHFPLSLSSRDKSAPQLCLSPSGFLLPPQPSRRGAGRVGEVAPTPLSPSSFSSSSLPGKVRKAVATLQLLLHLFSSAGVGVRGVCACHFPRLCTIPKPLTEEIPVTIFLQAQAHTQQAAASQPCLFPAGW